jgi:DNA-binding beta-propeller fold protein YncE
MNFPKAITLVVVLGCASSSWAEKVVVVAGGGQRPSPGPATSVKLDAPFGVGFDMDHNMYIVELSGGRLLRVDRQWQLTTLGGNASKGDRGDGGPAAEAQFNGMHNLALDRQGNIYLADTWNNRVRKVDATLGMISNFAGTGNKGFSGDGGPAAAAQFGGVYSIAFDPEQKQMFLADLDNLRIRAINMETGRVRTVAGNSKRGVPNNGATAADAPLVDPRAVAADRKGNVYLLERTGNALRVVDRGGKIRTVVGRGSASAKPNDARPISLLGPKHLCVDADENVLIADSDHHAIRKYLPRENRLVNFAGSGKRGAAGSGGPALDVELDQPHGVAIDQAGTVYICDSYNHRVLKIEP